MIARALPRRSANRCLNELTSFVWQIEAWVTRGKKKRPEVGAFLLRDLGSPASPHPPPDSCKRTGAQ
jgi:hypothetical protein